MVQCADDADRAALSTSCREREQVGSRAEVRQPGTTSAVLSRARGSRRAVEPWDVVSPHAVALAALGRASPLLAKRGRVGGGSRSAWSWCGLDNWIQIGSLDSLIDSEHFFVLRSPRK